MDVPTPLTAVLVANNWLPLTASVLVPVTRLLKRRVVTKVGRRQDRDRPHLPMGDQMLERTTRTIKGEERPAVRWGPDGAKRQ